MNWVFWRDEDQAVVNRDISLLHRPDRPAAMREMQKDLLGQVLPIAMITWAWVTF